MRYSFNIQVRCVDILSLVGGAEDVLHQKIHLRTNDRKEVGKQTIRIKQPSEKTTKKSSNT